MHRNDFQRWEVEGAVAVVRKKTTGKGLLILLMTSRPSEKSSSSLNKWMELPGDRGHPGPGSCSLWRRRRGSFAGEVFGGRCKGTSHYDSIENNPEPSSSDAHCVGCDVGQTSELRGFAALFRFNGIKQNKTKQRKTKPTCSAYLKTASLNSGVHCETSWGFFSWECTSR